MSNGPPASHLCLLSDLPSRQVGDKVRFLGCVVSYSSASGVLILQHRVTTGRSPTEALVNVDLILDRLEAQLTRVGEWVNVVGYIESVTPSISGPTKGDGATSIHVQGILVWSAGSLDVQRYEASVDTLISSKFQSGGETAHSEALLRAPR
ncbi:CST complex subunit Ten1 [Echria macrotheca]|uniref:CST complex subunit Ten1 n=1 Tax=Echria macrotheca TaxID=438768 RepID=A0AAJ0F8M2_9PEZI|nr:CST complex subunit Ten1 [Echria macrotheca]